MELRSRDVSSCNSSGDSANVSGNVLENTLRAFLSDGGSTVGNLMINSI
jgi:hypothetical protein